MNNHIHSLLRTAAIALTGGSSLLLCPAARAQAANITLPYEQKFNSKADAGAFTVIDNNHDGYTWNWTSGAMVYAFNAEEDADDWLISPLFAVDSRHVYQLSFKAAAQTEGTEKLAVSLGAAPTIEAQTTVLMPPTDISAASPRTRSLTFRPTADVPLCVGFHALSSHLLGYGLTVDNISIKELTSVDAPDTVTQLRAVADANGGRSATVSFNMPTKTIAGNTLTGKLRASIVCWGDTLKTFTNCDPGQALSYVHNSDATGEHVYTVVVDGKTGKGLDAQVTTYIGEDKPAAVTHLSVKQTAQNRLHVTWTLPQRGAHGGWINTDNVAFKVTDLQGKADTVRVSSYDYTFKPSSRQQLQAFTVEAFNRLGKGDATLSDTLFVGDAYQMPFKESFARKLISTSPWILQENADAAWIVNDRGVYAEAADHDGGLLSFSHATEGSHAAVIMPKVSVEGSTHPRLKLWMWRSKKQSNELAVYVKDAQGQEHLLGRLNENATTSETGEWKVTSYALDAFKTTSPIQVKLYAVGHIGQSQVQTLYVDNISITDVPEYDLALDSFDVAQTTVKVGTRDTFSVRVTNLGVNVADNYRLRLLRNGKEVSGMNGPVLQPDESAKLTLYDTPNADADENSYYQLCLDYADDVHHLNDSTARVAVNILPGLPFVSELSAVQGNDAVQLSWQRPLVTDKPAQWTTESFETYPAFTITNMGEWTLYDGDGRPTMGIRNAAGDFIDYPHAGDPMAFQVLNPAEAGLTSATWQPHSGAQVAAAFTCGAYAQNDDWLISPRVDGQQTITFWAKSPDNTEFGTTEQIEVYASADSTQLSAFSKVGNTLTVPGSWKQYSVSLPEGTRYFALRCVSRDQYILFIDDIYYRRAEKKLTLMGYQVYRDGTCVTSSPVTDTRYTDKGVSQGRHSYTVTTVYDAGESAPSPEAIVDVATSVDHVASAASSPAAYFNTAGQRISDSASGLVIVKMADGTVRKVVKKQR